MSTQVKTVKGSSLVRTICLIVAMSGLVWGGIMGIRYLYYLYFHKVNVEYGEIDSDSINGLDVFRQQLQDKFDMRRSYRMSSNNLETVGSILYVDNDRGLPKQNDCDWLITWLNQGKRRQAVIVLRHGDMSNYLLNRWINEYQVMPGGTDTYRQINLLEEILASQTVFPPSNRQGQLDGFSISRVDGSWAQSATEAHFVGAFASTWAVPSTWAMPVFMDMPVRLQHPDGKSLVGIVNKQGDNLPWILEVPVGKSRMLVVTTTQPLLDGALPDPQARRAMMAFMKVAQSWSPMNRRLAWVAQLELYDEDDKEQSGPLMIFTKPPFSWFSWHAVGFSVVVLLMLGLHLARRNPPRSDQRTAFSLHVEALGRALRQVGNIPQAAAVITRRRSVKEPPYLPHSAAAEAWANRVLTAPLTPGPEPTTTPENRPFPRAKDHS